MKSNRAEEIEENIKKNFEKYNLQPTIKSGKDTIPNNNNIWRNFKNLIEMGQPGGNLGAVVIRGRENNQSNKPWNSYASSGAGQNSRTTPSTHGEQIAFRKAWDSFVDRGRQLNRVKAPPKNDNKVFAKWDNDLPRRYASIPKKMNYENFQIERDYPDYSNFNLKLKDWVKNNGDQYINHIDVLTERPLCAGKKNYANCSEFFDFPLNNQNHKPHIDVLYPENAEIEGSNLSPEEKTKEYNQSFWKDRDVLQEYLDSQLKPQQQGNSAYVDKNGELQPFNKNLGLKCGGSVRKKKQKSLLALLNQLY